MAVQLLPDLVSSTTTMGSSGKWGYSITIQTLGEKYQASGNVVFTPHLPN